MSRAWVVTGGVGFIGYHVRRALLSRGDRVTIVRIADASHAAITEQPDAVAEVLIDYARRL